MQRVWFWTWQTTLLNSRLWMRHLSPLNTVTQWCMSLLLTSPKLESALRVISQWSNSLRFRTPFCCSHPPTAHYNPHFSKARLFWILCRQCNHCYAFWLPFQQEWIDEYWFGVLSWPAYGVWSWWVSLLFQQSLFALLVCVLVKHCAGNRTFHGWYCHKFRKLFALPLGSIKSSIIPPSTMLNSLLTIPMDFFSSERCILQVATKKSSTIPIWVVPKLKCRKRSKNVFYNGHGFPDKTDKYNNCLHNINGGVIHGQRKSPVL